VVTMKNGVSKRRLLQGPHGITSQKTPFFNKYPISVNRDLFFFLIEDCRRLLRTKNLITSVEYFAKPNISRV
jgi:hypothetical protein